MPARTAFGAIDCIATIFVLLLLTGVGLPLLAQSRESARSTATKDNLRRIGAATLVYAQARRQLPFGTFHDKESPNGTCDPRYHMFHSGWTEILPHLDHADLFNRYARDLSYRDETDPDGDGWSNRRITEQRPPVYVDPAMPVPEFPPHSGWSSYAWSGGNNSYDNGGNLTGGSGGTHDGAIVNAKQGPVRLTDLSDGQSLTFLAGEAHYTLKGMKHSNNAPELAGKPNTGQTAWGAGHYPRSHLSTNTPVNTHVSAHSNPNLADWYRQGAFGFRSSHPGGCHFVFCDGSVRFINESISPAVYKALGSRAGGELVSEMDFSEQ
jgi:prepilin-type processing-associated H-X9-DG protein